MKSNKLLLVAGILMIAFGGLAIVMTLVSLAGVIMSVGSMEISRSNLFILLSGMAPGAITNTVFIVGGIVGIIYAMKPRKAVVCIVFGIIAALLALFGLVTGVMNGFGFPVAHMTLIARFIATVIYIIGAFQNEKWAG